MATKTNTSYNRRQEAERTRTSSRKRGGGVSHSTPFSGASSLWRQERVLSNPLIIKFIIGLILGAFTLYVFFAFFSYLIEGAANQSLFIDTATGDEVARQIKGHVGVHGSRLMHNVVNGWLGLGIIFVIYLLGFISLSLMVKLRASLSRQIIFSVTMAFWSSLALSLLPDDWTRHWFFLPGGVLGQMMEESLQRSIGIVGIYILLILVLVLLLFLSFGSLRERYTRWTIDRTRRIREKESQELHDGEITPGEKTEGKESPSFTDELPGDTDLEEPVEAEPDVVPVVTSEEPIPDGSISYNEDGTDNDLSASQDRVDHQNKVAVDETSSNGDVKLEVVDNRSMEDEVDDSVARSSAEKLMAELGPYDPRKELSSYRFPPLDLLKKYDQESTEIDQNEIRANKELITNTFKSFNIDILSITATVGPAITLYEVVPAAGVHISRIRGLEENIAMSLSALGIRIIAPMPGKGTIGLEVPNKKPQIVSMRSVIASNKFTSSTADLPIALGRTITNEVFVFDLAKAPHLLVAGATGQGKSVGLNAIITSLLYTKHPSELKFVMVDPKMVEFSMYSLIEKHYMAKLPGEDQVIITDTKRVAATLNSLCQEMDDRYELLAAAHVRNIKEYNEKFVSRRLNPEKGHRYLPYIVLIIDEYGDLLITAGKEIEIPITRLAQKARAIGIHAIIATQRPTAKIITGAIKANFPGRIAFRVTSSMDSRIILDTTGANRLVGKGDLLYQSGSNMTRVQCAFVDTPEVNSIVEFISKQRGYTEAYELPEVTDDSSASRSGGDGSGMALDPNEKDEIYDEVARMLVLEQRASISLIQQKFSIGYNRAARLMNQLVAGGVVTPKEGNKPQDVIPSSIEELEI